MAASERTSLVASFNASYSYRSRRSISHSIVASDDGPFEDATPPEKVRVCCSYRLFIAILALLSMIVCFSAQASMSSAMVCAISEDVDEPPNSTNQTGVNGASLINSTRDRNVWKFDWDKDTQGWILASLYMGYYVAQIPSSIACARFGPKRMIMLALVLTSVSQCLTVPAARLGLAWLYVTRILTGFITGFLYAPVFALVGFWAPRYETSFLLGFVGMGLELGNSISFGASMAACEVDFQGGWPLVFYILAAYGLVVAVLVGIFVSDTPFDNRFISQTEVGTIAASVPASVERDNEAVSSIPVKSILKSMPVWAIVVSQLGANLEYYMMINSLPMFFKDIIKLPDLEVNLLSGMPFLAIVPTIYFTGMLSDRLVAGGTLSITKIRKMNDFVCKIVAGAILVGMGFVPEGSTALAFVLNILGAATLGFSYVGWLANPVDLAPAYTGFIVGIGEMGTVWVSIVIPLVVNAVTENKERFSWQLVFYTTGGMQVITYIFYAIFASGELQPWAVATYTKDYGSLSMDNNEKPKREQNEVETDFFSFNKLTNSGHYPNTSSEERRALIPSAPHSAESFKDNDPERAGLAGAYPRSTRNQW